MMLLLWPTIWWKACAYSRKPVLTHASIVCEGMLASVNSVDLLMDLDLEVDFAF